MIDILIGVVCLTAITLLLIGILLFAESKLVQKGNVKITVNGDGNGDLLPCPNPLFRQKITVAKDHRQIKRSPLRVFLFNPYQQQQGSGKK